MALGYFSAPNRTELMTFIREYTWDIYKFVNLQLNRKEEQKRTKWNRRSGKDESGYTRMENRERIKRERRERRERREKRERVERIERVQRE
jgi:hypothetical protein